MKKTSKILLAAALVISHAMVGVVAFNWASMRCAILHFGTSAPEWVAFLLAVPFAVAIAACLVAVAIIERKK